MVIPPILGEYHWSSQKADSRCHAGRGLCVQLFQPLTDANYTQPNPNSKRIERSRIGIVTFTGLQWVLVEVEHNSQSREEKQQAHHTGIFLPTLEVPEHSYQPQYQWQKIKLIVR